MNGLKILQYCTNPKIDLFLAIKTNPKIDLFLAIEGLCTLAIRGTSGLCGIGATMA